MKSSLPLRVEITKQNVRYYCTYLNKQPKWELRRLGIEPGSTAWKEVKVFIDVCLKIF